MKASIIIAFYNNIKALSLMIKALELQTENDFEVIIAEDDNNGITLEFINNAIKKSSITIKHVRQIEDNGFRKNQMLNSAIRISRGNIIIFLDGDSIPHEHLVKEYTKTIKEGVALFGRRVMLSEELSDEIQQSENLKMLTIRKMTLYRSKRVKYALYVPFIKSYRDTGIWGCNWGIFKKHLIDVNGFDEDYQRAGVGEDIDIEWRLKQIGIKLLSIRYGAITYHLHHPANYSQEDIDYNLAVFEKKKEGANYKCKNGLEK